MLLDESCCLLAIDLDGDGWREDAEAVVDIVRNLDLPVALERSRSGNGAHLWFFFEEAIPAIEARRFGAHLLTEAMEIRPDIGLTTYDRMFPNQDTLPKGGFGNLIALPLQKAARVKGNSVFLDRDLQPISDQWAFLAQVPRIATATVSKIVRQAERGNRVLPIRLVPTDDFALTPWQAPPSRQARQSIIQGPVPDSVELVLSDKIYIP